MEKITIGIQEKQSDKYFIESTKSKNQERAKDGRVVVTTTFTFEAKIYDLMTKEAQIQNLNFTDFCQCVLNNYTKAKYIN